MTTDTDDEYSDRSISPFGGATPAAPQAAAAAAKAACATSVDTLSTEIRSLAEAQAQIIAEVVDLQTSVAQLPTALAGIAQDAATQQEARAAELVGEVKSDIGQLLAAISAQQAMPQGQGQAARRGRLGWLSIASLVGAGSSAAVGGVVLGAILGLGQPLRGEAGQMASYVWLTQGQTLRACLEQMHRTGQGVQCPVVFHPSR